jgi:predicted nucleic acid-binding protein
MPEPKLVIDTGPILALTAATGDLQVLQSLYEQVLVPWEVSQEILAGGPDSFGVKEFAEAEWLRKMRSPTEIPVLLRNSLDAGEASVIQLAINENVPTVCIDESVGRRIARLSGLSVTGSLGVLLRAQREGLQVSIPEAIARMREKGIWLSESVARFAVEQSGEE